MTVTEKPGISECLRYGTFETSIGLLYFAVSQFGSDSVSKFLLHFTWCTGSDPEQGSAFSSIAHQAESKSFYVPADENRFCLLNKMNQQPVYCWLYSGSPWKITGCTWDRVSTKCMDVYLFTSLLRGFWLWVVDWHISFTRWPKVQNLLISLKTQPALYTGLSALFAFCCPLLLWKHFHNNRFLLLQKGREAKARDPELMLKAR